MTKKLSELLEAYNYSLITGKMDTVISSVCFDSRKVEKGSLFIAVPGTKTDGHDFIDKAVSSGAVAVICKFVPSDIVSGITYIKVENTAEALGWVASAFYDNPSRKLKLVGITGTNGKTTTVTLLYQLFKKLGFKTGLLSTVINYIHETPVETTHTTPDSLTINKLLHEMVQQGCSYCFMEVSSHSVVQNRIAGLLFAGGVFSNLTHDHLDFHKSFDEYLKAKKEFFDKLTIGSFALVNKDDKNGMVMVQNTVANVYTYALKSMADFKARIIEKHFEGMLLNINGIEIWTHFIGLFNAYNLLAVYSTASLLFKDESQILTVLSTLVPVTGRFECVRSGKGILAIIDYAHTPDAIGNVLSTIRELTEGTPAKVITVVGAGGDRDKTKRPEMARIAYTNSDTLILTSDNPRTEEPSAILNDMTDGLSYKESLNTLVITDRREAIRTASRMAGPGDIILIAGKGHETYQEINGVKYHFSDREEIEKIFEFI